MTTKTMTMISIYLTAMMMTTKRYILLKVLGEFLLISLYISPVHLVCISIFIQKHECEGRNSCFKHFLLNLFFTFCPDPPKSIPQYWLKMVDLQV